MKVRFVLFVLILAAILGAAFYLRHCGTTHERIVEEIRDRSDDVRAHFDDRFSALDRRLDRIESKLDRLLEIANRPLPDALHRVK